VIRKKGGGREGEDENFFGEGENIMGSWRRKRKGEKEIEGGGKAREGRASANFRECKFASGFGSGFEHKWPANGAERAVERCTTKVHTYLKRKPPGKSINYTHLAYL
jgi:hypothetical protein